jgi:predicted metallopeptidase
MDSVLTNRYSPTHDATGRIEAIAQRLQHLADKFVAILQEHQQNRAVRRADRIMQSLIQMDHRMAQDFARR